MLVFLILPVFAIVGCADDDTDKGGRIQGANNAWSISQYYYVGEELALNGQTFDYYKKVDDDTPTEKNITVTKEMISGFSTATKGDFYFQITYKNATSEYIRYHVYDKPTLTGFEGKYSCTQFGGKTLVELTSDKVNILTYATPSDIINNTPKSVSTDYTIGVISDGAPIIKFNFDGNKYYFYNFGADGKATMFGKENNKGISGMTCSAVNSLEYAQLDKEYNGTVSSDKNKNYSIKVVVGQNSIKATLTRGEDVKTFDYENVDFSINSCVIISATEGQNRIRVTVKGSKNIYVTNSNSVDSESNFRADCACE